MASSGSNLAKITAARVNHSANKAITPWERLQLVGETTQVHLGYALKPQNPKTIRSECLHWAATLSEAGTVYYIEQRHTAYSQQLEIVSMAKNYGKHLGDITIDKSAQYVTRVLSS